jgi:hypothetical protein
MLTPLQWHLESPKTAISHGCRIGRSENATIEIERDYIRAAGRLRVKPLTPTFIKEFVVDPSYALGTHLPHPHPAERLPESAGEIMPGAARLAKSEAKSYWAIRRKKSGETLTVVGIVAAIAYVGAQRDKWKEAASCEAASFIRQAVRRTIRASAIRMQAPMKPAMR